MPELAKNIATQISKLASENEKDRQDAAYELFRLGCAAIEPTLQKWFADPEFRALAAGMGSGLLTVGIAVQRARFEEIRERFRQPKLADVPADQDALEFGLSFAHGVRLDVLAVRTAGEEGAIAKFLARFGEGIQQVECNVRDVARATEIVRKHFGIEPIYPTVRAGANHTRVNFFLVPIAGERKILVELVEAAKSSKRSKTT